MSQSLLNSGSLLTSLKHSASTSSIVPPLLFYHSKATSLSPFSSSSFSRPPFLSSSGSRPFSSSSSSLISSWFSPDGSRRGNAFRTSRTISHPGFVVVPQQSAYIIERFGKFREVLKPGFHFLIPLVDRLAYIHSLKEEAIAIPNQNAITKDNVTIQLDGVLYIRIENAYDASYGIDNPLYAVTQLAQTTMRSELGKLTLDETFLERETLNGAINRVINTAASSWGIKSMRYEIRDIVVPSNIKAAMERQAEAERRKRAEILQSEAEREADINISQGRKAALVLQAQGEAEAIRERAKATAEGLRFVSEAIEKQGGSKAVSMQLAEQYVDAFSKLARSSNTIIIPANANDTSGMIGQALAVFNSVQKSVNTSFTPPTDDTTPKNES